MGQRLEVARLLLDIAQLCLEVYDRWKTRVDEAADEAEMSPAEAREYAQSILDAADRAEADARDGGEEWNAP